MSVPTLAPPRGAPAPDDVLWVDDPLAPPLADPETQPGAQPGDDIAVLPDAPRRRLGPRLRPHLRPRLHPRRARRRGRVRKQRRWTLVLGGTVVAAALRVWAIGFGLPYMLHPDEPTNFYFSRAMAVHGTMNPRFFNYPSLMPYAVAGWLKVAGAFGMVAKVAPLQVLDPSIVSGDGIARTTQPVLFVGARGISVALGVVLCLAVARATWNTVAQRRAMALALLVVGVAPLAVRYSRFIAPDIYAACFYMLAVATALKLLQKQTRWVYVVGGLMVGFAAGSKYTGAAALVPLLVAHVAADWRTVLRRHRYLYSIVAAVGAFLLTTPYVLLEPGRVWKAMQFEQHHYATDHPGYDGQSMRFYLDSLGRGYGWITLGLAAIGLLMLLRWRPRAGLVLLTAIVPYFLYMGTQMVHFERNIVMIVGPLAVLAGVGADGLLAAATDDRSARRVAVFLVTGAILLPLSITSREAAALGKDPRIPVSDYISKTLPAGATVVVEPYGPWVDPAKYHVRMTGSIALHSAVTYRHDHVDYLIADSQTYNRLDDPKRFAHYAAVYHDLFGELCEVRRFVNQGYVFRILATAPDACSL